MLIDLPDDLYPDFSSFSIGTERDGPSAASSCGMQESKHGSSGSAAARDAAQRTHVTQGSQLHAGIHPGGPFKGSQHGYMPIGIGSGRPALGGLSHAATTAAVPVVKPVLRPHAIPIRKPGEPAPSKANDNTSCGSSSASSANSPSTPAVKPPAPASASQPAAQRPNQAGATKLVPVPSAKAGQGPVKPQAPSQAARQQQQQQQPAGAHNKAPPPAVNKAATGPGSSGAAAVAGGAAPNAGSGGSWSAAPAGASSRPAPPAAAAATGGRPGGPSATGGRPGAAAAGPQGASRPAAPAAAAAVGPRPGGPSAAAAAAGPQSGNRHALPGAGSTPGLIAANRAAPPAAVRAPGAAAAGRGSAAATAAAGPRASNQPGGPPAAPAGPAAAAGASATSTAGNRTMGSAPAGAAATVSTTAPLVGGRQMGPPGAQQPPGIQRAGQQGPPGPARLGNGGQVMAGCPPGAPVGGGPRGLAPGSVRPMGPPAMQQQHKMGMGAPRAPAGVHGVPMATPPPPPPPPPRTGGPLQGNMGGNRDPGNPMGAARPLGPPMAPYAPARPAAPPATMLPAAAAPGPGGPHGPRPLQHQPLAPGAPLMRPQAPQQVPRGMPPGGVPRGAPPAPLQLPRLGSSDSSGLPTARSPVAGSAAVMLSPDKSRSPGLKGPSAAAGSEPVSFSQQDVRVDASRGGNRPAGTPTAAGISQATAVGAVLSPSAPGNGRRSQGVRMQGGSAAAGPADKTAGAGRADGAGGAAATPKGAHSTTSSSTSSQDVRTQAALNRAGSGGSSSSSSTSSVNSGAASKDQGPRRGPAAAAGQQQVPAAPPAHQAPALQRPRGTNVDTMGSTSAGWPGFGQQPGPAAGWAPSRQTAMGGAAAGGAMAAPAAPPRMQPSAAPGPGVLQPTTPQGSKAATAAGGSGMASDGRQAAEQSSQDVRVQDTCKPRAGAPSTAGPALGGAPGGARGVSHNAAPAGTFDRAADADKAKAAADNKGLQQHLRKLQAQGVAQGRQQQQQQQPAAPSTPRISAHSKASGAGSGGGKAAGAAAAGSAPASKQDGHQGRTDQGSGAWQGPKANARGSPIVMHMSAEEASQRLLRTGQGAAVWVYLTDSGAQVGPLSGPVLQQLLSSGGITPDTLVCGFTHAPPNGARLMAAFFQPLQALLETVQAGGRYDPLVPGPARS